MVQCHSQKAFYKCTDLSTQQIGPWPLFVGPSFTVFQVKFVVLMPEVLKKWWRPWSHALLPRCRKFNQGAGLEVSNKSIQWFRKSEIGEVLKDMLFLFNSYNSYNSYDSCGRKITSEHPRWGIATLELKNPTGFDHKEFVSLRIQWSWNEWYKYLVLTYALKLLPQIWPSDIICLILSNSHSTWPVRDRGTFFCWSANMIPSLKLTWHLKMDGWNTSFLLGWPIFRGYVSFREGIVIWHAFLGLPVVSIIWWHTSRKWWFSVREDVEFIEDTSRIQMSVSFCISRHWVQVQVCSSNFFFEYIVNQRLAYLA